MSTPGDLFFFGGFSLFCLKYISIKKKIIFIFKKKQKKKKSE